MTSLYHCQVEKKSLGIPFPPRFVLEIRMWSWALLKPPNILMATVSRLGPEDRWTAALGSKSSQPGNLQDLRPHGFSQVLVIL